MGFDFVLAGNGWDKEFFYANGEAYEGIRCPAGGLLAAEILRGTGCSVAPVIVKDPVMTEHVALDRQKTGAFSAGRSYGFTAGASSVASEDGIIAVVWDEGLDSFSIPKAENVLWSSNKRLPSKDPFEQLKNRAFLLLSADVLRTNGALISRQISWERTATELVWQLKNNPKFAYLLGVPHMLVTFSEDGAVFIEQSDGEFQATLTLLHGGFEGQLREQSGVRMPDVWAGMVAAAAWEWKACLDSGTSNKRFDVGSVLQTASRLLESGYVPELIKNKDFGEWLPQKTEGGAFLYRVPVTKSEQNPDPDYWCAVSAFAGAKLQDLAFNYVLEGAKVIEGIPRFSCGALTTIDRREIEAFQNVRGLIVDYAASVGGKPLSIAVFGAPGSGKSFGVTQIAKSVLPGVAEKLEFNVSQMVSQGDLSAAFHQVRDVVLSGKLPIVFFDEFDSDRDGRPLGWLKSFLMPMQDGKFRDESGEHPIGKCILVFAGGTSPSFEDFCRPMTAGHSIEKTDSFDQLNILKETPERIAFKNAKGPDFVSRLRGTINVLGPNPAAKDEQNHILRRALLLRSLLERKLGKGRLPVSKDVLRALLLVPQYKHGARSMESVLDMSRMEGVSWEPASLPFYTQLSLHVDADAFIRLVLRDVVLNAYNEQLARTIHEDYLAKAVHEDYLEKNASVSSPLMVPWDALDEEGRKANREQALDIPAKLLTVGCGFDSGDTPYPTLEAFTQEEILRLAQDEHIRWMAQKTRDGWQWANARDDAKKLHPCLVGWEDLPPEEKQKDIDVAENIIPLLKKAGLRVYRTV